MESRHPHKLVFTKRRVLKSIVGADTLPPIWVTPVVRNYLEIAMRKYTATQFGLALVNPSVSKNTASPPTLAIGISVSVSVV